VKWEYMRWRVQDFHSDAAHVVRINDVEGGDRTRPLGRMLEQAGNEEWELVSVAPIGQGGIGILFFKRPKAEDRPGEC
jgi:hypothetical protein